MEKDFVPLYLSLVRTRKTLVQLSEELWEVIKELDKVFGEEKTDKQNCVLTAEDYD